MCSAFHVKSAHGFCNIRIDPRLPLHGSIDLGGVVQVSRGKLPPPVKKAFSKAPVKFNNAGLAFNATKIETRPPAPEARSEIQAGFAAILEPCHWSHMAGIFQEAVLQSPTKSLFRRKTACVERSHQIRLVSESFP